MALGVVRGRLAAAVQGNLTIGHFQASGLRKNVARPKGGADGHELRTAGAEYRAVRRPTGCSFLVLDEVCCATAGAVLRRCGAATPI